MCTRSREVKDYLFSSSTFTNNATIGNNDTYTTLTGCKLNFEKGLPIKQICGWNNVGLELNVPTFCPVFSVGVARREMESDLVFFATTVPAKIRLGNAVKNSFFFWWGCSRKLRHFREWTEMRANSKTGDVFSLLNRVVTSGNVFADIHRDLIRYLAGNWKDIGLISVLCVHSQSPFPAN